MDQVGFPLSTGIECLCSNADGMYGNFAGRDASRGMAKQSFDVGECSCRAVSSFEVSSSTCM